MSDSCTAAPARLMYVCIKHSLVFGAPRELLGSLSDTLQAGDLTLKQQHLSVPGLRWSDNVQAPPCLQGHDLPQLIVRPWQISA